MIGGVEVAAAAVARGGGGVALPTPLEAMAEATVADEIMLECRAGIGKGTCAGGGTGEGT